MDIATLLEAFQDFEKRGKKDTIPLLEQFLSHIAKTGEPQVPWTHFKPYFIFKLESIMDSFHASTPEERPIDNPNVDCVSFEEMKKRILKIVDGYIGIPFTIQRLCELLTDPKRNYSGTEKFLRGLEKNVMVVSCVCPTSEKYESSSANKMNGVMFQGNSLYSESRNINGPSTPKPLRSRLALSSSFSTNGLPVSKESESTIENTEDHMSDTSSSEEEESLNIRTKNKHEEEGKEQSVDSPEVKRLKRERRQGSSETEDKGPESLSETPHCSTEEHPSDAVSGTPAISEIEEPCNSTEMCENQNNSSEDKSPQSETTDSAVDQQEQDTLSETNSDTEPNDIKSCDRADGEEPMPSTGVSTDLKTDCDANSLDSSQTENKPEEQE
uniref:Serine/threonine-protein phosphatase 4 regulatory subunit 2 n=1 Tax=Neogobius melanostomus TaxID=47308 RepID=A0A8C6UT05_9GOBI